MENGTNYQHIAICSCSQLQLELFSKHNCNNQVKKKEIGRACITYGKKRNAYMILMGEPRGQRSIEKFRPK
jgi:hypothetical protein